MKNILLNAAAFAVAVAVVEAPASAVVFVPAPEPEVAGGAIALGLLAVGYRLIRRKAR